MYFVLRLTPWIVCISLLPWVRWRPGLKHRVSTPNSSNKHGNWKADEIFTVIWRNPSSPCENSVRIPLESHEIPEGGSRSYLMAELFIWALWMKKDNYRKRIIKIKIKSQHHQLVQNLVQSCWHGKHLMKTSSIRSNNFQKRLRMGLRPRPRWGSLIPTDPLLHIASHLWRLDPTRVCTFGCCPTWEKKWNDVSVPRIILSV